MICFLKSFIFFQFWIQFYSALFLLFSFTYLYCLCVLTERKKESEKLAVVPKKSSARRQKALQTEKVCQFMLFYM